MVPVLAFHKRLALAIGRRIGASFAQGLSLGIVQVGQVPATSAKVAIAEDRAVRHAGNHHGKHCRCDLLRQPKHLHHLFGFDSFLDTGRGPSIEKSAPGVATTGPIR